MTENMSFWATTVMRQKYLHEGEQSWEDIATRVVGTVMEPYFPEYVEPLTKAVVERKFMPGGRYLYATGKPFCQTQNCLLLSVEDSRESIADLMRRVTSGLMTGAGIGIVWSALREEGAAVKGMGGTSTGPLAFMSMVNEIGRNVVQGGSRRAAIWAGLHWNHPDIFKFVHLKDWDDHTVAGKALDFNYPATMDMTNVSIILDDEFFLAYENPEHDMFEWAQRVYWEAIESMLTTGEPGFSIDVKENAGEHLRNACQPASATLLSPKGIITMGDLSTGDQVWSEDGWVTVLNKWSTGIKPVYRYSTTFGAVEATADHRIVQDGEKVEIGDAWGIDCLGLPGEVVDHTAKMRVKTEYLGDMEVFDITVSGDHHTYWSGGHNVSNCTEVSSSDDNDICNLGSLVLPRIETLDEFKALVEMGTAFLMCGTLYSAVPFTEVADTRTKNRRLGLGLMGVYEWLAGRGYAYEPNDELATWLDEYAKSGDYANAFADRLGVSRPVKTRAIAPTGTLAILAETTSGIEPLFAAAYKRRYRKGDGWKVQYVVDSTAERLVQKYGIDPDELETAYTLAKTPERRIAFQAWVQKWVDHGISSTLNLPSPSEHEFTVAEFGDMLIGHLPELRGITAYPDGARGGQPLTVASYAEAWLSQGVEMDEVGSGMACVSGSCGI